ncbi:B-cell CLL/lymphoma 9 protein isoform X2 [Perognathus longimembris pacificus]|uniref:B-cell CLL/lymphoma 9 protein isoform X2 n=1 Tax=Perognathus longimembris pacificus TaxID=214514 RepID=UPI0020190EFF|nr:B-cell CLL/lymphoma 9 protein isoform X2 [Perognathus longimembris pacificus]
MHSSNPKVRNSPSGNTQSSPKSKQEVMVRPPTVMSPSGNPQLDSKFSNQECNSADHIKSQDSHTPHSMTPSTATAPRSSTPSHGQTTVPEPTPAQKTPAKVVYVFSTEMANKAAEAVLKGQVETIVSFHIQNISNSKTERSTAPLNTQIPALRNDPKPLPQQAPAPAAPDQNSSQNTRLQPTPPIPAPAPKPAAPPRPLDQESPGVDSKLIPPVGSPASTTPLPPDGTAPNSTPNNRAVTPVSQGSSSSSADPKAPPPPPVSGGEPPTLGENPDGLSQEQLEHRERSLQTLRDIQRMLFPDEKEFTGAPSGGPPQNPGVLDGPQKKPEGPIQAMMAQSQSLGKGPGSRTDVGAPFGPQGHRDVPFSPDEMVPPPLNSQSGPLGPDHLDHMTPEQIAWLKLQQEFYEEKRRKQEQVVVQQCSLQDMMAHQHGPRGVVRGPPPPYQMAPGEGWAPGGAEPFPDGINISHTLPPRGMAPHPSMPGSQMRLPAFAGMMNSDMEGPSVPSAAPRPGLSGVSWPDDVPKIPDGRNFPPGQGVFSGPGRGERFPNPQGLSEEMFQQQLAEKQLGLPPGMSIEGIRPGLEVNRMVPGSQRHLEPGNNPIFPRIPVEGPLSPSRGDFPKGMPPQLGPGRELEFGLVPGGLKGDVSLNVSMASGSQMIPQKMREAGAGPEDMLKLRPGSSDMLPGQQKMVPLPFGEHPQPEYGMGPRPFLPLSQGPGNNSSLRNLREPVGPDQRTNSRLSHVPPLPLNPSSNPTSLNPAPPSQRGLGRKPLDIAVAGSQVHSPGMNPLKSPTMHQVQSPMLGSPSGNLKSPQTPSQLAGMLAGPAAAASIKSPPVLGSAAASPVHLKSPSLPAPSPGWTSSPKPPLQSPGIPPNHKAPLTMTSPAMLGSVESGGPPPPPTASQPASVNLPGSLPSSTPYTMPPEPTLSQNPLSIMMSRMSKFAMPSSTPLYHDAIKTVASSDDDSPPARSPNLPSMNNMPGPNPVVPMPTLSPMGMTQPLSHSSQMPSPNAMGSSIPPHGVPVGPGLISHNAILGHASQEPPMGPQGRMGFPQGFPPVQSPPQQVLFPHNGPSAGQGSFPGGMGFPGEGPLGRPANLAQSSADTALCKPGGPGGPDSFAVLGNSMPSVFTDPDLQEVIRPGATGIPEFDLSRIIPSEKPSQTLQYFPRGEVPGRKQPPGPGPGFAHMQGMMGDQAPRMGLALPGMGAPGPVGTADIPLGTAPSMPGHNPMRPPTFLQQGMMAPHHRMMSPAASSMPGQPALMSNPAAAVGMIAGKERGPAGLYAHPGPVGSPGMMMSMQGMMGPQQNIMIPPQMRPRGMAADVGLGGFSQGPGNPGNMMF